jgi:GST-like protein
LAEKTGRLIPLEPELRYETIQWLFFQVASIGPMFGQVGYFNKFAGRDVTEKRPLQRYVAESKRLLGVLEHRLLNRRWVMGEIFTVVDISMIGWVRNIVGLYEARQLVDFDALTEVPRWLAQGLARPSVQRGLQIPNRP